MCRNITTLRGLEPEATTEEIEYTVHAHPTLSEALHEAVLDATGIALHI